MSPLETKKVNIPSSCIQDFKSRISKINKRAAKIGCDHIEIIEISAPIRRTVSNNGYEFIEYNECIVEYTTPDIRIGGWSLVGRISRDQVGAICIFDSGLINYENYTSVDFTRCDHCHTKHNRSHIAVLANGDGEEIIVGKSCLKDFLGLSPNTLYKIISDVDELEKEEFYSDRKGHPVYKLSDLVSMTLCIANKYGFVKSSDPDPEKISTAQEVVYALKNNAKIDDKYHNEADKAIDFIRNTMEQTNDYTFNIKQVFASDVVSEKRIALAVSFYSSYTKYGLDASESEYIGSVGDTVGLQATVAARGVCHGEWGDSNRFEFVDTNGNSLVCFTTSKKFSPDVGDSINITGKVKEHKVFCLKKQTVIKNIKIMPLI